MDTNPHPFQNRNRSSDPNSMRILGFSLIAAFAALGLESPVSGSETAMNSPVSTEWAGSGWGSGAINEAVKAALDMATAGKKQPPDLVIVFPTADSDVQQMLEIIREQTSPDTRIFGGTSDARGTLCGSKFVMGAVQGYNSALTESTTRGNEVALLAIKSPNIKPGIGYVSLEEEKDPYMASELAIQRAIQDAGMEHADTKPAAIITLPSIGVEHAMLRALQDAELSEVPLVGGTIGGPNELLIADNQFAHAGVSLLFLYTDLPVGLAFKGGYDRIDTYFGTVTKMEGQKIVEIDHEPAFEVYNRWMDGEPARFLKNSQNPSQFRDYLSLHPLARLRETPDGKTYTLLSHPWAPNRDLITTGLNTTTDIKEGERIFLGYSTWEILLNRIAEVPTDAWINLKNQTVTEPQALFSVAILCGGLIGTIPESERMFIPTLINQANNHTPFIGIITWGEQGQMPGIGNQHCNLTVGFLIVGGSDR